MIDERVREIVIETLCKVRPKLASRLQDPNIELPIADLEMDSLDAIEWCMEIEARTGIELDPAELVTAGSTGELISLIATRDRRARAPIEPPMVRAPRDKPIPLSLVQEPIWKHCRTLSDSSAWVLCMKDQIVGPLDVAALRDCLSEIVRRHEIVRTTFTVLDGQPV